MQHSHLRDTGKIEDLEKLINYVFNDKKKLVTALTHSSYANERDRMGMESNERLEFLGDAVLNTVISEELYKERNLPEGEMTRLRALIVCETSLAMCAAKLRLGDYLLLGKGEIVSGGYERDSILADAFEALIGAIYIDGGMESARMFIKEFTEFVYHQVINGTLFLDFKTKLQEIVQSKGDHEISYRIVHESGPDHSKEYVSQISIDGEITGQGKGRSKKEAEQAAARDALIKKGWFG